MLGRLILRFVLIVSAEIYIQTFNNREKAIYSENVAFSLITVLGSFFRVHELHFDTKLEFDTV